MRSLEFRGYSIHFVDEGPSQGFNSIQGPSAFKFIFFRSRKLIVEFLVNYPIPQLIICHSQGRNHFPPSVTKPKHAEEEKRPHHSYIPLPSMEHRTLCLSTEISSQDESEGSNVYLPIDGLIKEAMMSENRKNLVDKQR